MVDPDVPKSQGGAGAHQINVTLSMKGEHAEMLVGCGDRWINLILFHRFRKTC